MNNKGKLGTRIADDPLAAAVALSDTRLGRLLWSLYTLFQAERHGMGAIDAADGVRAAVRTFEADDVTRPDRIALSKALRHAARGEYAKAGRIIRTLLISGAVQIVAERFALVGARQHQARVRGGEKTALRGVADPDIIVKRKARAKRDETIVAERGALLADGRAPREVAGILARKHSVSARRIRQIIAAKEKRKRR